MEDSLTIFSHAGGGEGNREGKTSDPCSETPWSREKEKKVAVGAAGRSSASLFLGKRKSDQMDVPAPRKKKTHVVH